MPKAVISDTSCIIVLAKIGKLDLLARVYGTILITDAVAQEFNNTLPQWMQVMNPKDSHYQQILETQVDRGEASAIALALELDDCTIILDDHKARRLADRLGLNVTGTLGVIIKAKRVGIIGSIRPLLDAIRNTDFRLSKRLEAEALRESGE